VERVCRKCAIQKDLEDFPRKSDCALGHRPICQDCVNTYQRERRVRTSNSETKRYEKSPEGFLMRAYRNMKSRVTGVQKKRAHLYAGLPILPKDDFYVWAKNNPDFWRLYRNWVKSGYNRKLTPSVNRIDPDEGYLLGNIEFLTHSVNSSLARHRTDAVMQRIYAAAA